MTHIVALIHGRPGAYGISFPDLPGATAGGETVDEAVCRGRDMLAIYMDALIEDGMALPVARTVEALKANESLVEDFGDAVAVVTVEFPAQTGNQRDG